MSDSLQAADNIEKLARKANVPVKELGEGARYALSFFDLNGQGMAVKATGFNKFERMQRLISMIRSEDDKVALAALKEYRAMWKEIFDMHSAQGTHKRTTTDEQGRTLEETVTARKLIETMYEEDPDAQEGPAAGRVIRPTEDGASELSHGSSLLRRTDGEGQGVRDEEVDEA